jgi:hypothetical protein
LDPGGVFQNQWCGECRTSVEIVQFIGEAQKGDLLLKGRCGREVARVVETSERDASGN